MKILRSVALTVGACLVLLFGAFYVIGFETLWRIAGPADLGPVVWEGLKKGPRPNQGLVAPRGLVNDGDLDREAPVYAVDADALAKAFVSSLDGERSLTRVDDGDDPHAFRFVTYSPTMRYPDTTRVKIIPLDDGRSTIALYAQAQIGVRDFGANLARIERWLKRLSALEENGD
ncbi:MAG: DUF1499 domain-containing protein [Pseudomonadota bacterium]